MRIAAFVLLFALTLLSTAVAQHGAPYDWRADTSLLYRIAPVVQHRDGAEIHQYWQFPDDTGLWDTITPFFSSLEQYRAEIRERVPDTSPLGLIRLNRIMFAQSAALADTSEIANTLIVEGKVGHHRPMNCLETHLFAYQAARYPMLTHPTEFHAFILRRSGSGNDSVRVYFVASDQPFPPKPEYAISAIENDLTVAGDCTAICTTIPLISIQPMDGWRSPRPANRMCNTIGDCTKGYSLNTLLWPRGSTQLN
jgi:hypothetical protein